MEYTDVETGKRRDPPTAGLSVGTGFALLVFVACLVIAGFMIKDAGSSSSPVTPPSAVTTTSKFRLGFDKNIGLPENISDLVKGIIGKTKSYRGKEFTVSATGYTNVQELYNKRAEFDFLFIPAGVLPYLDKYTVLATSVMPGAEPYLQTQMTTMVYNQKYESIRPTWDYHQSPGKWPHVSLHPQTIIGYINHYCVTSYFSMMLWTGSEEFTSSSKYGEYAGTGLQSGYGGLLDSVVDGEVTVGGVWTPYLQANRTNQEHLGTVDVMWKLPLPLLITLDANLEKTLADADWTIPYPEFGYLKGWLTWSDASADAQATLQSFVERLKLICKSCEQVRLGHAPAPK